MQMQKRRPWDRPVCSGTPNRQGDSSAEPIYTALGRALSAWEGVNAATRSLFQALHSHQPDCDRMKALDEFDNRTKAHDRAHALRYASDALLGRDFGLVGGDAAKLKKRIRSTINRYLGWVARRNELAHGYVTEALSPDYSQEAQPIVSVYALLPSHARTDRWFNSEPEWNYLAAEIEEFARQFGYLDAAFEELSDHVENLLSPTMDATHTPLVK
jgi:hypothetical protein